MNKKLLMSLAPLLAVAAFALAPTAAQAAHWNKNGTLVGPNPGVQVMTWGKLTLKIVKGGVPGGFFTCKVADAGNVWNPEGGGAGEDQMVLFAFYECESEGICPAGLQAEVVAENLPWATLLTEVEPPTIRDEIKGIKLLVKCVNAKKVEAELKFLEKGSLKPHGNKGTSGLHPGFLEFDGSSGELEQEGSGGTITAKLEGVDKILGFNAQELINMIP
jgi:hypothetical protein